MNTKLFESRESNLIKPLKSNEIGYVFKSDIINKVVKDLDDDRFGSYLIGGVVGTGKSSLVDLAASITKGETFVVHIKFSDEGECVNSFLKIILESLIDKIYEQQIKLDDEFSKLVNRCKLELQYNFKEEVRKEKTEGENYEEVSSKSKGITSKIGGVFNKFFNFEAGVEAKLSDESKKQFNLGDSVCRMVTLTKLENNRMLDISQIIKKLDHKKIIFIYDELDKMNTNIIEQLFSNYKSLFVEFDMFNFFLVNEDIFLKYSNNDLIQNVYFTYFSATYYLPLLNLQETLRYCMSMFAEEDYLEGLVLYYYSLGNYRLINSKYLSMRSLDKMGIIKAYILKKIIDKLEMPYINLLVWDVLVCEVKLTIENIIMRRTFSIDDLSNVLEMESKKLDMWPSYREILVLIIEEIKEVLPDAVEDSNGIITVNGTLLYKKYNEIEKQVLDYRKESFTQEEKNKIQISDMYDELDKEQHNVYTEITYLEEGKVFPIEIAQNNPIAYKEALSNIIKANLNENKMQVIVLKRARNEESYYKNDNEYTGIVVLDKGVFDLAYYVDRGSYDSDSFEAIENIIKTAEEYGVNVIEYNIDKYIKVKDNLNYIIQTHNTW